MATIKSYTDLEQSRKLAEILSHESADMYYALSEDESTNVIYFGKSQGFFDKTQVAWSLASLLEQFEDEAGLARDYELWFCYDNRKSYCTEHYDNPIDACVEMIEKLHELNLL